MQTFDSNGPDVRIRGSAFQVHEKYLQLARDAAASGDRIIAESYLQHAEHYYRIIAAAQEQQQLQQQNDPNRRFRDGGYNGQDYRNGPPGEESGEGDEFAGEEQVDPSQQRFDPYVRPQQENRFDREPRGGQQDGRYQDPGARPQPDLQPRGQYDRPQQDGGYRQQGGGEQSADGQQRHDRPRHDGRQRFDRDGQRRRGPDGFGRPEHSQPQAEHEELREIRFLEDPRPPAVESPAPEIQVERPPEPLAPAPAVQLSLEPVAAEPEAAPPKPRRGRPRRAAAPQPEAAAEPATES
jgi:hypothetical protein